MGNCLVVSEGDGAKKNGENGPTTHKGGPPVPMQKKPVQPNTNEFFLKFLLIGDSAVGKTSILNRVSSNDFTDSYISTIGVDFKKLTFEINNKTVNIQIWDTAGQERYRAITTHFFRGANGVIIVYDVTNKQSFFNVKQWVLDISRYAGEDVPTVLVGNKIDLDYLRRTTTEEGRALAEKLKVPHFFEISAKSLSSKDIILSFIQKMAEDIVTNDETKN